MPELPPSLPLTADELEIIRDASARADRAASELRGVMGSMFTLATKRAQLPAALLEEVARTYQLNVAEGAFVRPVQVQGDTVIAGAGAAAQRERPEMAVVHKKKRR